MIKLLKRKITNYLLNNYIGVKSSNCHKPFIIKGINNNNNSNLKTLF